MQLKVEILRGPIPTSNNDCLWKWWRFVRDFKTLNPLFIVFTVGVKTFSTFFKSIKRVLWPWQYLWVEFQKVWWLIIELTLICLAWFLWDNRSTYSRNNMQLSDAKLRSVVNLHIPITNILSNCWRDVCTVEFADTDSLQFCLSDSTQLQTHITESTSLWGACQQMHTSACVCDYYREPEHKECRLRTQGAWQKH